MGRGRLRGIVVDHTCAPETRGERPALGGKTILEALKSGDLEMAIGTAASFGEQAA
jgi:hypothetical protein